MPALQSQERFFFLLIFALVFAIYSDDCVVQKKPRRRKKKVDWRARRAERLKKEEAEKKEKRKEAGANGGVPGIGLAIPGPIMFLVVVGVFAGMGYLGYLLMKSQEATLDAEGTMLVLIARNGCCLCSFFNRTQFKEAIHTSISRSRTETHVPILFLLVWELRRHGF